MNGILLGDFNTDILLPNNNVLANALGNIEHAFGLKQLIVEPTRVCINKESGIDQILVSDPDKVCQSGVLCVGISVIRYLLNLPKMDSKCGSGVDQK